MFVRKDRFWRFSVSAGGAACCVSACLACGAADRHLRISMPFTCWLRRTISCPRRIIPMVSLYWHKLNLERTTNLAGVTKRKVTGKEHFVRRDELIIC
uniref:Putative secreted protein n=1 Tax=Anopheles triannulatus TaxID=58253 RepID=A0A2M4B1L3_9DIPT